MFCAELIAPEKTSATTILRPSPFTCQCTHASLYAENQTFRLKMQRNSSTNGPTKPVWSGSNKNKRNTQCAWTPCLVPLARVDETPVWLSFAAQLRENRVVHGVQQPPSVVVGQTARCHVLEWIVQALQRHQTGLHVHGEVLGKQTPAGVGRQPAAVGGQAVGYVTLRTVQPTNQQRIDHRRNQWKHNHSESVIHWSPDFEG